MLARKGRWCKKQTSLSDPAAFEGQNSRKQSDKFKDQHRPLDYHGTPAEPKLHTQRFVRRTSVNHPGRKCPRILPGGCEHAMPVR